MEAEPVTNFGPLCDVCQALDLSRTNNREENTYTLGVWTDIHRKGSAVAEPACPFCALLFPFLSQYYGPPPDDEEIIIRWKKEGGFFFKTEGDNLAFLNENTATSPFGSARTVMEVIDPDMIKKWMSICEHEHGEVCKPKLGIIRESDEESGVTILRLVDVQDQCVVEYTPGTRYVALSYVWGGVDPSIRLRKDRVAELSTKGSLANLQSLLPKTLQDAIGLLQLIGERYLWVDVLCLVSDEDDDMFDGIAHMDLVYQGAALTIIAAVGIDANAGLPGVHPQSRVVQQQIVEVLPGVQMTSTTGVYNAMTGVYTSRGWTLQELILSHRTLIFTPTRVYFRCRSNCMSEDTIYDNFPWAINTVLHSGGLIDFLADIQPHPLEAYVFQLFRYAGRKLSKQSDTIHAFTGILRFLSVQAQSGTLEGLFTSSFDACILFWDNFPLATRHPGRREGFPSWSWAGWEGMGDGYARFCKDVEIANSWLRAQTYIVWYKRNPPNADLELVWDLDAQLKIGRPNEEDIGYRSTSNDPYGRSPEDALVGLQTKPDTSEGHRERIIRGEMEKRQYHFLQFYAYTVLVQGFDAVPEVPAGWAKVHPILGAEGQACGGLKFDDQKNRSPSDGPYELILLSKMDKYDNFFNDSVTLERSFYWVMQIEWVSDQAHDDVLQVAERRGIGFLFEDCTKYVLPPGQVWKEIVLV